MKKGKKNRAPKPVIRSEIGQVLYEETKFRVEVKDRSGNVSKDRAGNPITTEKSGIQFRLRAAGPQGIYRAKTGRPFEGKTSYDGSQYNRSYYVVWSDAGFQALNELLRDLWNEGWQPTSFGRRWYEVNMRRMLPEPIEPESSASKPPDQASNIDAKPAATLLEQSMVSVQTPPLSTPLPAPFQQALANYTKLREDYALGRVNPAQYKAALEQIRVQDPNGYHWTLESQNGSWLMWNGTAWVPANPAETRR